MTDREILKQEIQCIKRQKGGICDNKRDCGSCDLRMTDAEIIAALENAIRNIILLERTTAAAQIEAIKDFAERLKEKCHNYYPSIDSYCLSRKVVEVKDIDNFVKEAIKEL